MHKFTIPVYDAGTVRRNAYQATAVVRIKKDKLYLYDIKPVEFDVFRREAGLHTFNMSPTKWIEDVNKANEIIKQVLKID